MNKTLNIQIQKKILYKKLIILISEIFIQLNPMSRYYQEKDSSQRYVHY